MSEKIYAPAVDRNKEPILEVLKQYITGKGKLLEIGSGTGQHAVYFANHFKKLIWVTSDIKDNHKTIKEWVKESGLENIQGPKVLKIGVDDFPKEPYSYVFTANTLHIMSWKEAKALFKLLGKRLREGSLAFFYGPFNYECAFTSESNRLFDESLKIRDEKSGIRNFEDVLQNMNKAGFKLLKDHEMPVNNRLLVFERMLYKAKKDE